MSLAYSPGVAEASLVAVVKQIVDFAILRPKLIDETSLIRGWVQTHRDVIAECNKSDSTGVYRTIYVTVKATYPVLTGSAVERLRVYVTRDLGASAYMVKAFLSTYDDAKAEVA